MLSPEISALDPSITDAHEAKWHDSVMKCFVADPTYADVYVPNDEDLTYCPDPDPAQFHNHVRSGGYNHALYEYAENFSAETIRDLPWAVRYLFYRGYTPDTAKLYVGEVALRKVLTPFLEEGPLPPGCTEQQFHDAAQMFSETLPYLESQPVDASGIFTMQEPALVVIKGIHSGEILNLDKLRGSISNQHLATVDVGAIPDKEGVVRPRRIVCAGIPVTMVGQRVAVALPGALIAKQGANVVEYKTEKVRARSFTVGRRKYKSEGILLSYAEGCGELGPYRGAFHDRRNDDVYEVHRLPNLSQLPPGTKLDNVALDFEANTTYRPLSETLAIQRTQDIIDERMQALRALSALVKAGIFTPEQARCKFDRRLITPLPWMFTRLRPDNERS